MKFAEVLKRYLCPDLYVKSVVEIDLDSLQKKGYTTLLIDLDNTLLSWRAKEISSDVVAWVGRARELGYKMEIISNTLRRRVHRFADFLRIPGTSVALKPRKQVFLEAIGRMNSKPEETAVIGDQLFTDVLGGKRAGLFTILVSPVDHRELFTTELARIPERWLLGYFRKRGLFKSRSFAAEAAQDNSK